MKSFRNSPPERKREATGEIAPTTKRTRSHKAFTSWVYKVLQGGCTRGLYKGLLHFFVHLVGSPRKLRHEVPLEKKAGKRGGYPPPFSPYITRGDVKFSDLGSIALAL